MHTLLECRRLLHARTESDPLSSMLHALAQEQAARSRPLLRLLSRPQAHSSGEGAEQPLAWLPMLLDPLDKLPAEDLQERHLSAFETIHMR